MALSAMAGLIGLGFAVARRVPSRAFWVAAGTAMTAMVIQVLTGVVLFAQEKDPGTFHMFYGFLVLFALAFAYMSRSQLGKRPGLTWGLLLLFVMGLGLRAIATFEAS